MGDPTPFLRAARRYGSDPAFDKWARRKYGVSGPALLVKEAKGESHFDMSAVSSAGAKGGTQFMPETREEFIKRYGVDAWKDPDSAVHATKLYLQHDPRGVAGYNPGMPTYTDYILKQKVGDVGAGRSPGGSVRASTTTTPGTDNSQQRAALVAQFLSEKHADPVDFALGIKQLRDAPGRTVTTTSPGSRPAGGGIGKKSPLLELFWQGPGGVDVKNGQRVPQGFVSGHTDHVHVAAGPKTVVQLGKLAQSMGLNVGENSHFNGGHRETSGHAPNSYHYRDQAIDVSGDPKLMAAFARRVARIYRVK